MSMAQHNRYAMHAVGTIYAGVGIPATAPDSPVMQGSNLDSDDETGQFCDDDLSKLPSYNLKKPKLGPETQTVACDTSIRDDFQEYTEKAMKDFCNLTAESKAGIELRGVLQQARAPLHLYNKIFHWHLRNPQAKRYLNQRSLVTYLTERYNLSKSKPIVTSPILLPHSNTRSKSS